MNKTHHRLIFNKSRCCMMAVSEVASSCSKSSSGSPRSRRRATKCSKTTKRSRFILSNAPSAQSIRAQEAINLVVSDAATSLTNASATIEALGNLDMNVAQVRNTNEHFTYSTPLAYTQRLGIYPSGTYYIEYDRYVYSPVATSSDPAKILAGGNINLNAQSTYNYASHIVAGRALNVTGNAITNAHVQATQYTYDYGTTYTLVHYPQTGNCGVIKWRCVRAYDAWVTGPYANSSQSTVAVSQPTPATASGKLLARKNNEGQTPIKADRY